MHRQIPQMIASVALAAQALVGAAGAADLQRFSGTWAYTAAGCGDYLHGRIANEARMRGAGLLIIRPAEIEWITPATCAVSNLRAAGGGFRMDGKCEIKGRDFSAGITLEAKGADRVSLSTDAAEFGHETHAYARCSKATRWRSD
jgi:hypothetical protein